MARPVTNRRKTCIGLRESVSDWIEFMALGRTTTDYLNDLAEADKAQTLAEGGEIAERYRAYLVATGRTAALEALDGGNK